jgi:hypothetical protein
MLVLACRIIGRIVYMFFDLLLATSSARAASVSWLLQFEGSEPHTPSC